MRTHGRTLMRAVCTVAASILLVVAADAQEKLDAWREDYNGQRPHGALMNMTPEAFAQQDRSAHSEESDQRRNGMANDVPDNGPKLRLTV